MTSDINNPLVFVHHGPDGWSQLLTHSNGKGAKNSKGAHLSCVMLVAKHKGKWLNWPR